MRKIKFLFYIGLLVSMISCKPELKEPSGIIICDSAICQMNHDWKTSITDSDFAYGNVSYPIVYNYGTVVMAKRNDSMFLRMIDAETGFLKWEKPRKIRRNKDFIDCTIDAAYQKDNYLILPYWGMGTRGVECINLENGEQLWEKEFGGSIPYFVNVNGLDSLFFCEAMAPEDTIKGRYPNAVFCGNIYTGSFKELCIPPIIKENELDTVLVESITPAIINNQINVLVGYSYKYQSYIGLYNKETKAWVYSNKKVSGEGFINTSYLDESRFYIKSIGEKGRLICGNIEDGSIIWQDSLYSIVYNTVEVNNCIIARDGPFNLAVAALDKYTGKVKWRCDGVYPWMYIQELNGVIYFDNGWLYAIDGYTGKKLWKMEPKDFSRINDCKVVPGKNGKKGRVVACADRYAFGYEAIR